MVVCPQADDVGAALQRRRRVALGLVLIQPQRIKLVVIHRPVGKPDLHLVLSLGRNSRVFRIHQVQVVLADQGPVAVQLAGHSHGQQVVGVGGVLAPLQPPRSLPEFAAGVFQAQPCRVGVAAAGVQALDVGQQPQPFSHPPAIAQPDGRLDFAPTRGVAHAVFGVDAVVVLVLGVDTKGDVASGVPDAQAVGSRVLAGQLVAGIQPGFLGHLPIRPEPVQRSGVLAELALQFAADGDFVGGLPAGSGKQRGGVQVGNRASGQQKVVAHHGLAGGRVNLLVADLVDAVANVVALGGAAAGAHAQAVAADGGHQGDGALGDFARARPNGQAVTELEICAQ